jgi:hypothetical protein
VDVNAKLKNNNVAYAGMSVILGSNKRMGFIYLVSGATEKWVWTVNVLTDQTSRHD